MKHPHDRRRFDDGDMVKLSDPVKAHVHDAGDVNSGVLTSARLPQIAAIADVTTALTALDATLVPSLINLIGGGGLEAETRVKVNQCITMLHELRDKLNEMNTKQESAGYETP